MSSHTQQTPEPAELLVRYANEVYALARRMHQIGDELKRMTPHYPDVERRKRPRDG